MTATPSNAAFELMKYYSTVTVVGTEKAENDGKGNEKKVPDPLARDQARGCGGCAGRALGGIPEGLGVWEVWDGEDCE